ncbi:serine/threonine protein kinase [Roseiflexus sp.]|uniref:serine/threonine protein kinase n=1 Tax=Roseiflexus sp. TaxID=2562120 RepID=UPI0021DE3884|nr:serine/threonine protein kinase [Roseiflexus sp.]GIW00584.1 MAG: ligand-binding protein SH3 [Roseiflexus sp.]
MAQSPAPAAPLLHDRYRIDERLGATRLAVIYRAYDERLQRQVLVALFREELVSHEALRRRFIAEAQSGVRQLHPSLLSVYDSGAVAGRPFMVMEYVSGRTLRDLGPLTVEVALLYFRQIVGAVAVCQAVGAPHPPISSANIVVVDEGRVKLVENWSMAPSEFGADIAWYRAPERVAGHPPIAGSVVYSLGLLLLEMLIGRRVNQGDDLNVMLQAHRHGALPTLAEMRPHLYIPSLAHLIVRATAPDPSQRFPDASALSQALDDVRRAISHSTSRLAPSASRPSASSGAVRGRSERASSSVNRPASMRPDPQPVDSMPPSDTMATAAHRLVMEKTRQHSLAALIAMVALFVLIGSGAYVLTSLVLEGLADIQLPRPQLTLPENVPLPDWLTGVANGSGEVLTVTIGDVEGLNLRDEPGLNTRVIALLPNGTRVRKLEGPRNVDNVPWVRVRGEINGRPVEGWVSQLYVRSDG